MQYPFRVVFATKDDVHEYVVNANDSGQARKRARRAYEAEHGPAATGDLIRIMNLTPRQENGEFLPRIDGTLVSGESFGTRQEAVDAALTFLHERAVR
jgi:hypothetical protein